ncbi:MAG: RimK family alpha-L-glutamate ligase [Myxococcales bacterium]|nr:RimK family alpha-L-glutamate ligase [Myxococcales bacterium]
MRIGILSCSPNAYSTERLRVACERRGHKCKVLNTLRFSIFTESGRPALAYGNKEPKRLDAVIPRIGASITFFGTAVVRHFEQMGVFTLNTSHAISIARDKLRSTQVLSRHAIGMPPTAFVREKSAVLPAIERVGGAPVIIKLIEGTQGIGVILAETTKTATAIIETLHSTNQNVLIQKFVAESKGRDIRAFVVGDRVVAAMRRVAVGDEFRSNVHRGGRTEKVNLDPIFEKTAIRAAQIMGLRVAGVDMLEGKDGPQVMEVNSSPGLQGIEAATKVDIADAIIEHLEEQVAFTDFDIRQRLTVAKGYGIAELQINARSKLAGKTVADSGLRDLDITLLSITRGSLIIPNPRPTEELRQGDTLLCFGKQIALKTLLPAPSDRRSAPDPS